MEARIHWKPCPCRSSLRQWISSAHEQDKCDRGHAHLHGSYAAASGRLLQVSISGLYKLSEGIQVPLPSTKSVVEARAKSSNDRSHAIMRAVSTCLVDAEKE